MHSKQGIEAGFSRLFGGVDVRSGGSLARKVKDCYLHDRVIYIRTMYVEHRREVHYYCLSLATGKLANQHFLQYIMSV